MGMDRDQQRAYDDAIAGCNMYIMGVASEGVEFLRAMQRTGAGRRYAAKCIRFFSGAKFVAKWCQS